MRQTYRWSIAALLLLAACESPSGPYGGTTPARVDAVSGDLQPNAVVGTDASVPLVARVVNVEGKPLRGKTVTFQVVSGGGTVTAVSAVTDKEGEASARWKVGTVAGDTQRVSARVDTREGQEPVLAVFRVVAVPGAPATLGPAQAGARGGAVSSAIADSIGVVVRDQYGNSVPGVTVNWAVLTGGGSFSPATSVTGANGVARTRWTLGATPGEQRGRATLQNTTTSIDITANAGTELRIVAGNNMLAFDETTWEQPAVQLWGPTGPINDAVVEWSVTSGGGSVSPAVSRTASSDLTARTTWTLGGNTGAHQLTARVGNLTATFNALRPAARPLASASTPGGRVLDAESDRALVLDSAGGAYTLRVRPLSGGAGTVVATGGADLHGRLFAGGVIYSSGGNVYDWRGGPSVLVGPGGGILREGGWAAWSTSTRVYRRNLVTMVTDSMGESRLSGVLDVSTTGQVLYVYTSAGSRYVTWGPGTSIGVASGTARVRVAGDTAFVALEPSGTNQFIFYKHDLVVGAAQEFYRSPNGQRPLFSAMGGRLALREEGPLGLVLSRLTYPSGVELIGRRPWNNSFTTYTETDQALSSGGSAAFLVREGTATWLVLASRATGATTVTQVPGDSRLLERGGSILLVTTSSVYVVE